LSGQLSLSFGGDSVTVPYDASVAGMQSALQSMPSVGSVQVPFLSRFTSLCLLPLCFVF